ncbi:MAG: bL27 family ribosomal protein [Rickettsiales bacterium]|nr:bL27 family ribosomal protein [Rickettsiales bacterium]
MGSDYTIFATAEGSVEFKTKSAAGSTCRFRPNNLLLLPV